MIKYFFSFDSSKHIAEVQIIFPSNTKNSLEINLPAWRPGRYQLQNFAKNILNFEAFDGGNNPLEWRKTSRNIWKVENESQREVTVKYKYYSTELNAGGSFVDQYLNYINPVNACMFLPELMDSSIQLQISKTESDKIASGLTVNEDKDKFIIDIKDAYQLFDNPFIVSPYLERLEFRVQNVDFSFWIHGRIDIDTKQLIADLTKIADYQITLFGEFPEKDYHFMLIVPEHTYYHGVEHANSTMMVLGENGVLPDNYYNDLLGLASHELFHAWNIAKIRPAELTPYDFTKENYFETCFVAEGFTTYYGDKVLFESGAIDQKQYIKELETTYRRHFEEADETSQSILETSFDLWVDGYEKGTPGKKASVYSKGAVVAQILDLIIQKNTNQEKSLDNVMRILWDKFGKTGIGYSYQDVKAICEDVNGSSLEEYFNICIESGGSIFELLASLLTEKGLSLQFTASRSVQLSMQTPNH
jgi:predicted metalloprotease with PDZ domain